MRQAVTHQQPTIYFLVHRRPPVAPEAVYPSYDICTPTTQDNKPLYVCWLPSSSFFYLKEQDIVINLEQD